MAQAPGLVVSNILRSFADQIKAQITIAERHYIRLSFRKSGLEVQINALVTAHRSSGLTDDDYIKDYDHTFASGCCNNVHQPTFASKHAVLKESLEMTKVEVEAAMLQRTLMMESFNMAKVKWYEHILAWRIEGWQQWQLGNTWGFRCVIMNTLRDMQQDEAWERLPGFSWLEEMKWTFPWLGGFMEEYMATFQA